jgi:hypothetical protein
MEVLDPFKAQFVVGLSVIANSNSPGCWNTSVVPGRLVKLAIKDDEWGDCPSFCIDFLDCSDPLPVHWLFCVGLPFLSDVVITLEVEMTPIWKPVSSKLKISSSVTPYFVIVSPTNLNHKLISFGSSTSAIWISNFRSYTLESSRWRFTKLATQFVPILRGRDGFLVRSIILALSPTTAR